ncbi:BrnA antitoxin family protein [Desulfoluna butyratoxydans]|uniref:Brna antitoxin of type ii toxin-antitoxin system n=1 Tax=Desulfoluna butyratoxydans TaxID=231438 RepID=A0A4U8YIP6_9BACT|nr:BrnA antitoxin family protein [Desulfoluna butyratoxydans]VFQ43565.1 brna antitoxin of type ii toxin-antitoxin system [Desulfoluna butyratoxydans]
MEKEYDFTKGKRGAVVRQPGKTRITIYLDNDVIDAFRAKAESSGQGYQTLINDALRRALALADVPLTEARLREVIREELSGYGEES